MEVTVGVPNETSLSSTDSFAEMGVDSRVQYSLISRSQDDAGGDRAGQERSSRQAQQEVRTEKNRQVRAVQPQSKVPRVTDSWSEWGYCNNWRYRGNGLATKLRDTICVSSRPYAYHRRF